MKTQLFTDGGFSEITVGRRAECRQPLTAISFRTDVSRQFRRLQGEFGGVIAQEGGGQLTLLFRVGPLLPVGAQCAPAVIGLGEVQGGLPEGEDKKARTGRARVMSFRFSLPGSWQSCDYNALIMATPAVEL